MNKTLLDTIKDIPINKKGKNVWIILLKDLGDYALYFNKTDNCFAGFEVHKIRIKEARECDIRRENGEIYHMSVPRRRIIVGNEEFGYFAWHYHNLDLVYEKYPQFKEYHHEIKSKLEDALITVAEYVSRVETDKTTIAGSKPSVLKSKSNITARKSESIILCKYCNYPNRILRGFYWFGSNKGKIKPLSDMLCSNCGHCMGHNVIDGVK